MHGTSTLRVNFKYFRENCPPTAYPPLPSFPVFSLLLLGKYLKGIHTEKTIGGWNPDRLGYNYDPQFDQMSLV